MSTLESSRSSEPGTIEYSSYVHDTISGSIVHSNVLRKSRFISRYTCNELSRFSLDENNSAISKMKSSEQISMDDDEINSNISGL